LNPVITIDDVSVGYGMRPVESGISVRIEKISLFSMRTLMPLCTGRIP